MNRPQTIRLGDKTSDSITLSTGAPQGCVLSPLLYSLFTNDCVSHNESVKLVKFADDTTVIGLIKNGNEVIYRSEVAWLVDWCSNNNLELNIKKTKEMLIDFRRKPGLIAPLKINDQHVDQVESFTFLGSTIQIH